MRICTVSSNGTSPPSATIFLIRSPSLVPYKIEQLLVSFTNIKSRGKMLGKVETYFLHLSAHEVTSWNVSVSKFFDELLTLSAFSRGGTTKNKGDLWVSNKFLDILDIFLRVSFFCSFHLICNVRLYHCMYLCMYMLLLLTTLLNILN